MVRLLVAGLLCLLAATALGAEDCPSALVKEEEDASTLLQRRLTREDGLEEETEVTKGCFIGGRRRRRWCPTTSTTSTTSTSQYVPPGPTLVPPLPGAPPPLLNVTVNVTINDTVTEPPAATTAAPTTTPTTTALTYFEYVELTFKTLDFYSTDLAAFKAQLLDGLASQLGLAKGTTDSFKVSLRAGSIIANVYGPRAGLHSIVANVSGPRAGLQELLAKPLDTLTVMNVTAEVTATTLPTTTASTTAAATTLAPGPAPTTSTSSTTKAPTTASATTPAPKPAPTTSTSSTTEPFDLYFIGVGMDASLQPSQRCGRTLGRWINGRHEERLCRDAYEKLTSSTTYHIVSSKDLPQGCIQGVEDGGVMWNNDTSLVWTKRDDLAYVCTMAGES